MNLITTPITGTEQIGEHATPLNTLFEFYRAFNTRDLNLMSANWLDSDDASMSNPLGGIRRGWNSIQEVYSKIFTGPAEVYVEFYDYTIHHDGQTFIAVGRERGFFRLEGKQVDLAIRTSRFYSMDGGKWRQVHHHGSIDDPALLAEYQSAVLGN